MFAKQLTKNSWLLNEGTGKPVTIVRLVDEHYVVNKEDKFKTLEEVAAHFGGKLVEPVAQEETKEETELDGFPLKHKQAYNVEKIVHDNREITVYKIKKDGKQSFAAGYYAVKFSNGYVGSFCPLLDTITQNESIGPVKTKLELNHLLSINNRKNNESN